MTQIFRRSAAVVAAAVSTVAALVLPVPTASSAPTAAVPTPQVREIPSTAGRGFPASGSHGVLDLAARGYLEQEYMLSGTASTYRAEGLWTDNGRWRAVVDGTGVDYTTRMVVVRPNNMAAFSGTVVVEWLNVSFGVDIPVDFSQSYEYFARQGIVYVGLTVQQVGAQTLTKIDPARYAGVSIPDDSASYDIMSQAAQAIRTTPALLGGQTPRTVLATGHSQSAFRLTTYANAIQPSHGVYDGIMLHGRAGGAAPINSDSALTITTRIREDLSVPVFTLQAETDIVASSSVRQDTARVRTWEVAGTAHADKYGVDLYNAANARDKAVNDGAPTVCDDPINSMTFRYAQNAAYDHLIRWARGGAAPPTAEPIRVLFGVIVVRDQDNNALGGVRLPDLDVPVATYGPNNSGGNVAAACMLLGRTTPFTPARIAALYPDHATYVARFTAAADRAVRAGVMLPVDRNEAVARAAAAPVP
ncbi:alpha/beta hydrolase domain-containing protein [Saccharothrix deserti]|uniref:alpha/beta hydrolase domain-containing protein n=1 Tax=Saccharothrix deserti TaxID=2593674 RepID=UPI001EE3F9E9|nr:alpha/beta hydrolase domain-containing protein [Saccharothrix deserti]